MPPVEMNDVGMWLCHLRQYFCPLKTCSEAGFCIIHVSYLVLPTAISSLHMPAVHTSNLQMCMHARTHRCTYARTMSSTSGTLAACRDGR